jgi:hypothetical protein
MLSGVIFKPALFNEKMQVFAIFLNSSKNNIDRYLTVL